MIYTSNQENTQQSTSVFSTQSDNPSRWLARSILQSFLVTIYLICSSLPRPVNIKLERSSVNNILLPSYTVLLYTQQHFLIKNHTNYPVTVALPPIHGFVIAAQHAEPADGEAITLPLVSHPKLSAWTFLLCWCHYAKSMKHSSQLCFNSLTLELKDLFTTTRASQKGISENLLLTWTSRALMEGINMEKSSQGCYKAMQLSQ